MLVALLVWVRTSRVSSGAGRSRAADGPGAHHAPSRPAGRWDGLTEEIARRGNRRPPRRSDPALRRRHLAAVLPADARR
jgi:hypothetical protein